MAQNGSKREVPIEDTTNLDYGKSFETLAVEYRWLKAHADLAQRLVVAANLKWKR